MVNICDDPEKHSIRILEISCSFRSPTSGFLVATTCGLVQTHMLWRPKRLDFEEGVLAAFAGHVACGRELRSYQSYASYLA